jgi:hypothetical protein
MPQDGVDDVGVDQHALRTQGVRSLFRSATVGRAPGRLLVREVVRGRLGVSRGGHPLGSDPLHPLVGCLSELAERADDVLTIPVERGGARNQPLGTIFEQSLLVYCDALVLLARKKLKIRERQMAKQHAQLV